MSILSRKDIAEQDAAIRALLALDPAARLDVTFIAAARLPASEHNATRSLAQRLLLLASQKEAELVEEKSKTSSLTSKLPGVCSENCAPGDFSQAE